MTRKQLQKHWPVIEAFKNGAEIETKPIDTEFWHSLPEPNFYEEFAYRIKQSSKWRPFKDTSEIQLGSIVRYKDTFSTWLVTGIDTNKIFVTSSRYTLVEFFEEFELSLDNGKTFQPCGVLE